MSANRNISPGMSSRTIRQETPPLSLLLSPPLTSPLIQLDTDFSPLQQYNTAQPPDPRFTSRNGSYPVYDPNRGAELRSAADCANPYRDRLERVDHVRAQERARSRSPCRLNQLDDLTRSRELPQTPFMEFNHYPREMYVPPGINDLMPRLPSSSPTLREGANNQEDAKNIDDNEEDHLCEFAAPCRMHPSPDGMHYRKVVSHVFGRNKAVTKLFPLSVWVHYCRKHYQRARYRADQWPFTQCDLLLESLSRMENWDGVESFELILRRREQMRVGREAEGALTTTTETSRQKEATPSAASQAQDQDKSSDIVPRGPSRKHPTAIIAPVPDWLRQHIGHGKSFEEIRQIIELVRDHMVRLRNQERVQQQLRHLPKSPSAPGTPRRGALSHVRKGRVTKSTNRDPLRVRASTVRFPDVEILPHFKPWVKEAALRQRSATHFPMNERDCNQSEQRISGGGHIIGEVQDTCDTNARTESTQPTNGALATNNTTPRNEEPNSEPIEMTGANLSLMQPHIGRAGTNRGQSESQRRRSERVYIKAIDRVPGQGPIKKPGKDGDK